MATQEQNWWEQDETIQPATAPGYPGVIQGQPSQSKMRDEARKDEDQAMQRENLRLSQEAAARAEQSASRLSVSDNDALRRKIAAFGKLLRSAQDFKDEYSGFGAGIENTAQAYSPVQVGTPGQRDWWSEFKAADNLIRNELFGASLSAGEKGAYAETSVEPGMNPREVRTNITRRLEEAKGELGRIVNSLREGGYSQKQIDATLGDYKPFISGEKPLVTERKPEDAPPLEMAVSGGETYSTDVDKAINAAITKVFQEGGSVEDLKAAAEAAGANVTPDDLANFKQAVDARAKRQPVNFIPTRTGRRNVVSQVLGEAAMTPLGTAVTGFTNAAGLGALSLVAGDQVKGLEALNPKAGFTGELAGSALGTAALAKAAKMGVGRVSSTLAERMAGGGALGAVAREVGKDAAYGGIYGANTGEGFVTGSALGALGSLGGQAVGAVAKRALPAFGRMIGANADEVTPPFGGGPDGGPVGGAREAVPGMAADAVMPDAQDVANSADDPFAPVTRRFNDAGASGTSGDIMRLSKAEGLPVPVELTQGAATRDAEQLAFEKEQIFGPLGGPLRARAEENNAQILQNFDRFIDMTGAELPDLASTGNAVTKALSAGYKQAKDRVNVAYKRAEAAGELAEPVSYKDVADFIAEQTPTTREKLAPVLNAVSEQLRKNDPEGTGQISLNALEDVRKLINRAAALGTADANYGNQLKGLIDQATEGKGGALYKKARALRIEQARKYENRAVVERLVANVKNKADAKTTSDEVVRKSILTESPEDIKFLRHALKTSGKDGRQAWRELQGATIRHIQEQATKNVNLTANNEPVVSAAGLNRVVNELDKSGRLDAIFDPATAQRVRDLRDVVQYINTVPPGTSINNSGTARTLIAYMAAMGTEAGGMAALTGIPVPVITGLKALRGVVKDNRIKKKISQSLIPKNSISAAQSGDYMVN